MTYSFPVNLAELILERWHTYVSRGDIKPPALPSLKQLRWILETIFFASLEREEGRDIRFTVCCVPASTVLRDGSSAKVPLIPLMATQPLSVAALRALAPAVRPDGAAILVNFSVDFDGLEETNIAGILHVGGDYVNARAGKSFYYQQPPYALTIEVRGPGELHVYQGAIKLAALISGTIEDQSIASSLDFVPATKILKAGEDALWPRIEPPEHEPPQEWAPFQWTALLNVIICIVNFIRSRGHGGTLLLVEPNATNQLPLKIKYLVNYDVNFLDDRFVAYINARHQVGNAVFMQEDDVDGAPSAEILAKLQLSLVAAERELCDAAETIATLSGVDGALVLTSALRLVGFGAEILLEEASPVKVFEVIGDALLDKKRDELDSESFGMRHRSAVRFVGAITSAVAFIVSQDGTVSFCWKQDGKVYIKRGVNTSNPNMAGA